MTTGRLEELVQISQQLLQDEADTQRRAKNKRKAARRLAAGNESDLERKQLRKASRLKKRLAVGC